jgi:pentatricopeptide repeat protein
MVTPAATVTDVQVRWMMEADGYRPQGRVWGSLITACGKAGQLGSAEALWTEMLAVSAAPTEDQYQALMNACVWTFQVLANPGGCDSIALAMPAWYVDGCWTLIMAIRGRADRLCSGCWVVNRQLRRPGKDMCWPQEQLKISSCQCAGTCCAICRELLRRETVPWQRSRT